MRHFKSILFFLVFFFVLSGIGDTKAVRASGSPAEILKDKMADFDETFASGINKADEFAALPKDLQQKLTADLADDLVGDLSKGALGRAMAENPKLIDSWKYLDDAGVDNSIRKNIDAIADVDAVEDAL